MSAFFGKRTPPKKGPALMDRKVKPNARYAAVGSVINSGSTVDKLRLVSTTEHLRRRDELFRRVSPSMIAELFDEYEPQGREDIYNQGIGGGGGGGSGGGGGGGGGGARA